MTKKRKPNFEDMEQPAIVFIVILRFISAIGLMAGILFLSAGRLNWWEAWVYLISTLLILIASRVTMFIKDPDLIIERMSASKKENVKTWDKVFVPVAALYLPLITLVVTGLDKRFGWSGDMPNPVQMIAFFITFAANLFATWASFVNRFFSSHVRIQYDRGHAVIKEGPYRWIRHPGYTGVIISWLATPIFFGSWWAWIPTGLIVLTYIIRTVFEDRTLQAELPGYKRYTKEVPYRLIPGIW